MSREAKYRVWFYDGLDLSTGEMISLETAICEGAVEVSAEGLGSFDESSILMQYTGLKDKDGVEIYESDVLRNPAGEDFKVVWNCNGHWGYKRTSDNSSFSQDWWECEVIGSVYETPELLENK